MIGSELQLVPFPLLSSTPCYRNWWQLYPKPSKCTRTIPEFTHPRIMQKVTSPDQPPGKKKTPKGHPLNLASHTTSKSCEGKDWINRCRPTAWEEWCCRRKPSPVSNAFLHYAASANMSKKNNLSNKTKTPKSLRKALPSSYIFKKKELALPGTILSSSRKNWPKSFLIVGRTWAKRKGNHITVKISKIGKNSTRTFRNVYLLLSKRSAKTPLSNNNKNRQKISSNNRRTMILNGSSDPFTFMPILSIKLTRLAYHSS